MFAEAGTDATAIDAMAADFRPWLELRLSDGRYLGFLAEDQGVTIAGIGVMELDWAPHPLHPSEPRRGYILNVFVEPSHRGQGIATRLMQYADEVLQARGIHYAVLHATKAGRPVYEKLGWASTAEMARTYPD